MLVASTGVIGVKLPMAKVAQRHQGRGGAVERPGGGTAAAHAIMTTDPFPKEAAVEVLSERGTFRVGGIAKGSGMIEPLMATMLGFLTIDALVEPRLLQRALKAAVDDDLQRDHRGRRVFDQRLRVRAGERGGRRGARGRRPAAAR